MKKLILLAAVLGTSAFAAETSPSTAAPTATAPSAAAPSAAAPTAAAPSAAAPSAALPSASSSLSGQLKSIDKGKHLVTIAPLVGAQQDLKVASSATITRDGASVTFDQLKSGDEVRASFDPVTNEATSLEVHSKLMKDMK